MSSEDKKVWGVHTQDDYLFLHKDVIAIGWKDFGDLKAIENTRDAFKEHYATVYPQSKKQAIANSAGMLYRFIYEVQAGDYIVFPSKSDRKINIGVVEGEYEYVPSAPEYVQQRKVRWIKHLPRTLFSQGALYESGSFLSLFLIKKYSDEFVAALDDNFKKDTADTEDETIGATAEDIKESTKDFILKELSKNLKGYDLEEFVADLLRAMGYRTNLSPHGGDGGVDITAYKDELPPRILVQVKSQDGDIKESVLQSLKGALREGDYEYREIKSIIGLARPDDSYNSGEKYSLYMIVKKHVDEIDCENLFELGAPNDEYDYESRTISEMLRSNMDVYQISSIIANVMESSFSHPYDTSFFVEIASKIKVEMQEEQIES